jgi:hypothetical protein
MWHPLDLLPKIECTHMPKVHKVTHPSPWPITYYLQRKKEREKVNQIKCQSKLTYIGLHVFLV